MHCRYIHLFTAIGLAIGLSLPPISPETDTGFNASSQSNDTFLTTASGDVTLSGTYIAPPDANQNPICDGAKYGFNIDKGSCDEAMSHATWYNDKFWFSYGQRGSGLWDIQLPFRRLSCEWFASSRPWNKKPFAH